MNTKTINNFSVYLHNCDAVANYNIIQIYKDLLLALSKKGIKLNFNLYKSLNEMEVRAKLNKLQNEQIAKL